MKKIVGILLGLIVFMFADTVHAIDRNELLTAMNDTGMVVLLCEYADASGDIKNEIYYMFSTEGLSTYNPWSLTYKPHSYLTVADKSSGTFEYVFTKSNLISYDFHNGHLPASKENTFTCPKHSFLDNHGIKEMCFSDLESCGPNFDEGPFSLTNNATSIYNVMDGFIKNAYNQVTFDEYKSNSTTIEGLVQSKALEATKSKYEFETKWIIPQFVTNYIKKNSILEAELASLKSRMETEANKAISNGTLSEEEKKEIEKKNSITFADLNVGGSLVPPTGVESGDNTDCNSLFDYELSEIINNIFKTIQYAGPILVIVLTALDLIKAVTSGEQEQMNKARDKFVKRLIAAMLLFFVPLLCSLIFDIVGITVPDSCIGDLK